jgi:hypothetical protein
MWLLQTSTELEHLPILHIKQTHETAMSTEIETCMLVGMTIHIPPMEMKMRRSWTSHRRQSSWPIQLNTSNRVETVPNILMALHLQLVRKRFGSICLWWRSHEQKNWRSAMVRVGERHACKRRSILEPSWRGEASWGMSHEEVRKRIPCIGLSHALPTTAQGDHVLWTTSYPTIPPCLNGTSVFHVKIKKTIWDCTLVIHMLCNYKWRFRFFSRLQVPFVLHKFI